MGESGRRGGKIAARSEATRKNLALNNKQAAVPLSSAAGILALISGMFVVPLLNIVNNG